VSLKARVLIVLIYLNSVVWGLALGVAVLTWLAK
jgi:hypothetical protein